MPVTPVGAVAGRAGAEAVGDALLRLSARACARARAFERDTWTTTAATPITTTTDAMMPAITAMLSDPESAGVGARSCTTAGETDALPLRMDDGLAAPGEGEVPPLLPDGRGDPVIDGNPDADAMGDGNCTVMSDTVTCSPSDAMEEDRGETPVVASAATAADSALEMVATSCPGATATMYDTDTASTARRPPPPVCTTVPAPVHVTLICPGDTIDVPFSPPPLGATARDSAYTSDPPVAGSEHCCGEYPTRVPLTHTK